MTPIKYRHTDDNCSAALSLPIESSMVPRITKYETLLSTFTSLNTGFPKVKKGFSAGLVPGDLVLDSARYMEVTNQ